MTNIRTDVVAILADVEHLDQYPNLRRHSNGQPLTTEQVRMVGTATVAEVGAAVQYAHTIADYYRTVADRYPHPKEIAMPPTTPLVAEAREAGHNGTCDLDAGCLAPAVWMLAEHCAPDLLTGDAAVAFYCDEHVTTAPLATLDAVQRGAASYDGNLWDAVLDSYPHPVRIA